MKEASILVPIHGKANFGTELPVQGPLFDGEVQGVDSESSEETLEGREGAQLFNAIKEANEHAAVLLTAGSRRCPSRPAFTTKPNLTKTSNESSSRIRPKSGGPSCNDRRAEQWVQRPSLLIAKDAGFGGGGRDRRNQGDVVGRRAGEG